MSWRLIPVQHCNTPLRDGLEAVSEPKSTPEETPALYFLAELIALKARSVSELREIHLAKLAYPGSRIIQDG